MVVGKNHASLGRSYDQRTRFIMRASAQSDMIFTKSKINNASTSQASHLSTRMIMVPFREHHPSPAAFKAQIRSHREGVVDSAVERETSSQIGRTDGIAGTGTGTTFGAAGELGLEASAAGAIAGVLRSLARPPPNRP